MAADSGGYMPVVTSGKFGKGFDDARKFVERGKFTRYFEDDGITLLNWNKGARQVNQDGSLDIAIKGHISEGIKFLHLNKIFLFDCKLM